MHIGKNNPKLEYTMRTENENKIFIETCEEKDLGVWITNDLKPEKQVIAASQIAMTVLRSVKRAFVRFDIETFSIIYTTFIRPHLNTVSKHGHHSMQKIYYYWRKSKEEPPSWCGD